VALQPHKFLGTTREAARSRVVENWALFLETFQD
jgi:hypothetical protein